MSRNRSEGRRESVRSWYRLGAIVLTSSSLVMAQDLSPLPDAYVGIYYVVPYPVFASRAQSLPPGLSLNPDHTLSGIPTVAGYYTFSYFSLNVAPERDL